VLLRNSGGAVNIAKYPCDGEVIRDFDVVITRGLHFAVTFLEYVTSLPGGLKHSCPSVVPVPGCQASSPMVETPDGPLFFSDDRLLVRAPD
jgi:hypothetical protein